MGVKLSSVIIIILSLFIVKVSFENFNQAQAKTNTDDVIQHRKIKIN